MTKNIYTQLLAAQGDFEKIALDSSNPHFKNKYASLSNVLGALLPHLRKHGIVHTATIDKDMPDVLVVQLTHAETGSFISSHVKLLNMADMQKLGSALTYAHRRGILLLCGVCGDIDEDGHIESIPCSSVTKAFEKPPAPKQILTTSERNVISFDLNELWILKEGSVRADSSTQGKTAILRFENDLKDVTDEGLIKLKEYMSGL